jgi:hypothetical protein
MGLVLPHTLEDDDLQGNFDEIKKHFPISRKDLQIETPHIVGVGSEPALLNSWVNYDPSAFQVARFWKDPLDIVHIEGLVKSGVINLPIFILPSGYRPPLGLIFAVDSAAGAGQSRMDIAPTGNVVPVVGANGYFSINCMFRRAS